ncbi:MAG: ABC transporter permease [Myxococcales bacterium]|jgi:phospholipid/cholesterol/gamma-HCH transport system permease protein|nr:ABC transporter permease [Myxococcales bacterium]
MGQDLAASARGALLQPITRLGGRAIRLLQSIGSMGLVLGRTVRALPRLDPREVLRSLVHFGFDAMALACVLGVFVGFILVLFSNIIVTRFGLKSLFGWASGYAVLREMGPFMTALVMAGRIGARNAAELGAMRIGGQLEGLRGVGVDPFALLVAPRVVASALAVTGLGLVASLVAILASIAFGWAVSDIAPATYLTSFEARLYVADLNAALVKLFCFGATISLVSTQVGLQARGGAQAIGQVAAKAVVVSAAALTALDWLITFVTSRVLA